MADKPFRPPSAYKHGGFSKTVLFPWEDADEFDALHRSLEDEWEPSGALEQDAVYTILTCIWRKRRVRDKRNLDTLAALQKKDFETLSKMPIPFFDTKWRQPCIFCIVGPSLVAPSVMMVESRSSSDLVLPYTAD